MEGKRAVPASNPKPNPGEGSGDEDAERRLTLLLAQSAKRFSDPEPARSILASLASGGDEGTEVVGVAAAGSCSGTDVVEDDLRVRRKAGRERPGLGLPRVELEVEGDRALRSEVVSPLRVSDGPAVSTTLASSSPARELRLLALVPKRPPREAASLL